MPGHGAELVARRAGRRAISASTASSAPRRRRSACAPSLGPDRLIVTPGIRPAGADAGDQKRIVTPAEGIRLGADHLVVARPIVKAADPRAAVEAIVREIARSVSLTARSYCLSLPYPITKRSAPCPKAM